MQRLLELLSGAPHEVATLILAMLPISELRGAIPYAVTVGHMSWQKAFVLSVVGNALPVLPILYFIGPVSDYLRRFRLFDAFFTWIFARTRRKGELIERLEAVGLMLFVAVPLPVTGAWTGSLAAFLFGIRTSLAFPAILLGVLLAGVIVTMATQGVISAWGLL
jgi:uncharacterized membrane protein